MSEILAAIGAYFITVIVVVGTFVAAGAAMRTIR